MNGDEYLDRRETILTGTRFSTCKGFLQVRDSPPVKRRSSDVPLVVDLAVLYPKSKGEGVSCPSNDIQDTTPYC